MAATDRPDPTADRVDVTGALAVEQAEIRALVVELADGAPGVALAVDVAGRRIRSDGVPGKADDVRLLFGTAELAFLVVETISALVGTDPDAALALMRRISALTDAEEAPAPVVPVRFRFPDERPGRRP